MNQRQDTELIDAVREYLRFHARRHGQQLTAEQVGMSRSTLWRFLWKDHVSPRLVAAVTAEVGDSVPAVRWATKRLNESRMSLSSSSTRLQLTSADAQTLEILCHTPLATVDDLAAFIRIPANTLRERLARLAKKGLVDSRPHRLQLLGSRPQRRFFPTREGIVAAAGGDAGIARLMRLYPVSRQWFRVLAERLEALAVLYRVAAMIADLREGDAPAPVEHCRSGPYDMRLWLLSGGSIGLVRQGPMLSNASLRYRIRTIERMSVMQRPLLTLILTDSEQDMRRTLRTIADPSVHMETFVAVMGYVIRGKGKYGVWQQGGYGFASTPRLEPNVSLAAIVARVRRLSDAYPNIVRATKRQSSGTGPTTSPEPTEQLDHALSLTLSRTEKRVLDLLASWPFCSPKQVAGLLDGVTERRANQLLRALREQDLVQREELGYVLSDKGLTSLARRDRAAGGPALDRWTPPRDKQGYIGSALQTMANQHRHQAGIIEFCAMLSAEAAHSRDHEILDLLPTHRSQISYEHRGAHYMLYPDASFQLGAGDDWFWCLLEFERRATTPKRVPERLHGYHCYFASECVKRDHGGTEPLVLFLFESVEAEATFLDTAARLRHAPFVSSNLPTLTEEGVLGPSWRQPHPHLLERVPLHAVRTGRGHVPTCNFTRPERFVKGPPRPTLCPTAVQHRTPVLCWECSPRRRGMARCCPTLCSCQAL